MYRLGNEYLTQDQVNERLRAMSYREREAFKAKYHLREHTLDNWAYLSWQTTQKVLRALSAQQTPPKHCNFS